jgi:sporulation protein YlmC with PRC-barrel domain
VRLAPTARTSGRARLARAAIPTAPPSEISGIRQPPGEGRPFGNNQPQEEEMKSVHAQPQVLSASTLKGDKVRNSAGEDLGKIEEFMIDLETGRLAYAVLSFGGFLGVGNKLFAVPFQAMTLDTDKHEFVLNVDKTLLKNAPGFDKDRWPDMADRAWGSQVYKYYGIDPYWQ